MEKVITIQKLDGGFLIEAGSEDIEGYRKIVRKLSEVMAEVKEFLTDEQKTE